MPFVREQSGGTLCNVTEVISYSFSSTASTTVYKTVNFAKTYNRTPNCAITFNGNDSTALWLRAGTTRSIQIASRNYGNTRTISGNIYVISND